MGDWRLTNQEKYLKGVKLIKKRYIDRSTKTGHDHCEFCLERFGDSENDIREGYCTEDDYHWICDTCYGDFKEQFRWTVLEDRRK